MGRHAKQETVTSKCLLIKCVDLLSNINEAPVVPMKLTRKRIIITTFHQMIHRYTRCFVGKYFQYLLHRIIPTVVIRNLNSVQVYNNYFHLYINMYKYFIESDPLD